MSQRHFIRSPMELPSPGFQAERTTPQTSDFATAEEVSEKVAIGPESSLATDSNIGTFSSNNSNNQWELQQLRGEQQDPLLAKSTSMMNNKRFSLMDVGRETVHLVRARSTFMFVFVATFALVVLLQHVLGDYINYTQRYRDRVSSYETQVSCVKNILYPWREAVLTRNLSSTKQDEFYTLFKQNCSTIFKDPPEVLGFFSFRNGTFSLTDTGGFVLADTNLVSPEGVSGFFFELLDILCSSWGRAAVAWGLLAATTTTMSYYSRPSHRDAIQMPSEKLAIAFGEQFSRKVRIGLIRVALTETLIEILCGLVDYFIAFVRCIVVNKTVNLTAIGELALLEKNRLWQLADPLPYLFLLSTVAAALEPGMWGFKALWRGIQLARGNRLKSYFIFLTVFLILWLYAYLSWLFELNPEQTKSGTLSGLLWRSVMKWSFSMMGNLPHLFLVPVFYFLCKAWREKAATMA